jgi:hypothetical protein
MITEDDVVRALDKPRAPYSVQQAINLGSKSTDELHGLRSTRLEREQLGLDGQP